MACTGCGPMPDLDAIAQAYYAAQQATQEGAAMPEVTEEQTTVYWLGDPETVSVSIGSYHDLQPRNGKLSVAISAAVYLTSARPDLFGPIAPNSAPTKASSPAPTVIVNKDEDQE